MNVISPNDGDKPRQRVTEIVARYPVPSYIQGFDVIFDDGWDGDPGIWVNFHTPARLRPSHDEIQSLIGLTRNLYQDIRRIEPDRDVYVRFVVPPAEAD